MNNAHRTPLGTTEIYMPRLIFGSSALGNLYRALDADTKRALVSGWISSMDSPVSIDTAGKYGAGLALEEIGRNLRDLAVSPADVVISNKLGWRRVVLEGDEPTFEPGVWKNLKHDAEQAISYDGILSCWRQGNDLLGDGFAADLVSVHDPDEYLLAAVDDSEQPDDSERKKRFVDVLDAYRALTELRNDGRVKAVGVGSKDWRVIREITSRVDLDWVMFAGSLTVYTHPDELIDFIDELSKSGVYVVNSAVFNAGFIVGGEYFDYRYVTRKDEPELFTWRDTFLATCKRFDVRPADACVEFGLAPKGVSSVALNTTKPERIGENVRAVENKAPPEFWSGMKSRGLIDKVPREM